MAVVKVTLITNGGKKTDTVNDSTTIRQIYEKYDVNYDACTNTVDSVPLRIGDLDKSLRELGCGESVRMSSIVKMDNANGQETTVIVGGSAAIVKSRYTLDQWKTALKYEPDLGIYDENDEKVFGVFIDEGPGSLNGNGVVFSDVPESDGRAVVTILVDPSVEDKKAFVKEQIGLGLHNLLQVEEDLDEVIKAAEKFDQEIDAMVKSI